MKRRISNILSTCKNLIKSYEFRKSVFTALLLLGSILVLGVLALFPGKAPWAQRPIPTFEDLFDRIRILALFGLPVSLIGGIITFQLGKRKKTNKHTTHK
jgi:O-antigen/teichoic acid export membrane protein